MTTVGSSFPFSGDANAFEVGPSGPAYDAALDMLFVSSEVDSCVYAIVGAGNLTSTANTGKRIYQDLTHLVVSLDQNNGGAFGLAIRNLVRGAIRVAAVDDNQNVLNMWTTVVR